MVAELARKVRAGFSHHACRELDDIVRNTGVGADKAFAARELARLHAIEDRWDRALYYLTISQRASERSFPSKEAELFYTEALTACGRSEEAESYARRRIGKGARGADYYCGLSNAMAARTGQRAGTEPDPERLELLNRTYRAEDLLEIGLTDPCRGFGLDNLSVPGACPVAPPRRETVSVLLVAHDTNPALAFAASSILNQTWGNVELVIVDDASSDLSWEVVEHLATQDPRIVAVRNSEGMGAYQARNRALSLATGDLIALHDSRDWSHPQMLQSQVEAMLAARETKVTFTGVACVSPDMKYALSLEGDRTEYVCRNQRSLLVRRSDLRWLDKWDGVAAYADEEFEQRARAIWGPEALRYVLPNVPMSLRMQHPSSRLSPQEAGLCSLASGASQEYARQAEFWRRTVVLPAKHAGQAVQMNRVSAKRPFPIPATLLPKPWKRKRSYDLVLISDLTLLGGTRRCNEGYAAAATRLGMNVGLVHWPRYDLELAPDIAKEYRQLSYEENIDILTADDRVDCDLLIVHHPPIMKHQPDTVPGINAKTLAILVNQLPQRFGEEGNPYYRRRDVEAACSSLFGMSPVWIPISPLVRRILSESGFAPLATKDWIPPLGKIVAPERAGQLRRHGRRRIPVVGRHSRDHKTKWPDSGEDLRAAYCADTEFPVRLLGGAAFARKVLDRWPNNWEELAFDSMAVSDFLDTIDFFVHYTHPAYVEEFGRNIMEALAAGVPAVVPPRFKEVFGSAACYAEPRRVGDLIRTLWSAESAYVEQVEKGFKFVRDFASNEAVDRRLQEAIEGAV